MSRIILPNEAPAGKRALFVPRGYEAGPVVLEGVCHTCRERFGKGQEQAWQEHVGRCAREHIGEIMGARAEQKKRMAVFDEETWDPEWAAHQRKVGQRMIREGRLVPKPNER